MAAAIVSKLTELAPARLTWRQLATLLGKKPEGGYFRTGKRDALAGGQIFEEDGFVRAVTSADAGGLRLYAGEALQLWRDVLPEPAPAIIDALFNHDGPLAKDVLARKLGYSPAGGYFRKGLSLLRQNGVIVDRGKDVCLVDPVPGQSA
jgi:hypothetical protein